MFLLQAIEHEECFATIYRRDDGKYESRIYSTEQARRITPHALHRTGADFHDCGAADSLPSAQQSISRTLGADVFA